MLPELLSLTQRSVERLWGTGAVLSCARLRREHGVLARAGALAQQRKSGLGGGLGWEVIRGGPLSSSVWFSTFGEFGFSIRVSPRPISQQTCRRRDRRQAIVVDGLINQGGAALPRNIEPATVVTRVPRYLLQQRRAEDVCDSTSVRARTILRRPWRPRRREYGRTSFTRCTRVLQIFIFVTGQRCCERPVAGCQ